MYSIYTTDAVMSHCFKHWIYIKEWT